MNLADLERIRRSIEALECIEQLCGSARDLHMVSPDGLATLISLVRQDFEVLTLRTRPIGG